MAESLWEQVKRGQKREFDLWFEQIVVLALEREMREFAAKSLRDEARMREILT